MIILIQNPKNMKKLMISLLSLMLLASSANSQQMRVSYTTTPPTTPFYMYTGPTADVATWGVMPGLCWSATIEYSLLPTGIWDIWWYHNGLFNPPSRIDQRFINTNSIATQTISFPILQYPSEFFTLRRHADVPSTPFSLICATNVVSTNQLVSLEISTVGGCGPQLAKVSPPGLLYSFLYRTNIYADLTLPMGVTLITVKVTDTCGNSIERIVTITVIPPPIIIIRPHITFDKYAR